MLSFLWSLAVFLSFDFKGSPAHQKCSDDTSKNWRQAGEINGQMNNRNRLNYRNSLEKIIQENQIFLPKFVFFTV